MKDNIRTKPSLKLKLLQVKHKQKNTMNNTYVSEFRKELIFIHANCYNYADKNHIYKTS